MGNNELYDRLEYDAIKTDWHAWMSKTAQALRHTDIRRFGTWAELERLSKNIPAMQWLVVRLNNYDINPSPVSPTEAALYILACYCPDNRVLGYVVDTLMLCYRTSDSKGMLMCARIHSVVNRKEEYPHLNGLYNIMMGFFLKEFARFLGPEWEGGSFMTENDFREAERYLPDFKASGSRKWCRQGRPLRLQEGNLPDDAIVKHGFPCAFQGNIRNDGIPLAARTEKGTDHALPAPHRPAHIEDKRALRVQERFHIL